MAGRWLMRGGECRPALVGRSGSPSSLAIQGCVRASIREQHRSQTAPDDLAMAARLLAAIRRGRPGVGQCCVEQVGKEAAREA